MERYDWQKKEVAEHGNDPKRAIWADPRTGKTLATIDSMALWPVRRTLVCCPLLVAPQWQASLEEQGVVSVNLYSGSAQARLRRIDPDGVYVVNYDFLRALPVDGWGGLVGDESHYIKSVSAVRARRFRTLAAGASFVRLLTGTPSPNHYGDLWGQLVALDRREWGSYESFARRYLIRDRLFPSRVLGYHNVPELQRRILQYATIVRREDVFGPDTTTVQYRTLILGPRESGLYRRLVRDWVLELGDGAVIDAAHVLTRLVRLQQLTSGYLPRGGTTGNADTEPPCDAAAGRRELASALVHSAKLDAVTADLDEIVASGQKAVIFHRFRWESAAYAERASKLAPTYVISGDTPVTDRARCVDEFQRGAGPAIIVAQIAAGGIGISMSEAGYALVPSRSFSYTEDLQAIARIYKPGAARVVTYYECEGTIDQYISRVLARKENVHEAVTHADIRAMAQEI